MVPVGSALLLVALLGCPLAAQGIKLNGPLANGVAGDVTASQISPDSRLVIYRADQEQDEVFQLYVVPIEGGPSVGLGSTPVAGGDVQDFRISSDSQRVVYRADQDQDEVFELYAAALSGKQPATKLNGPLAPGGDVASFQLARGRVVYLANQDSVSRTELYSVPVDGGTPMRLNGALVSGGNVGRYLIAPNGKSAVYAADQRTDQVVELFVVPIEGGTPLVLGQLLDAFGTFEISPNSRRVLFLSSGLYSVSILGGPASLLSTAQELRYGFHITPDSRRVLFRGPGDSGRGQLYSVPIAGGPAQKLSEHGGSRVAAILISPDSRRVAYSLEGGDSIHSVFTVSVKGGDVTPIREGGGQINVGPFSPDSRRLLYNELVEQLAYSAPAAGGAAIQLGETYLYAAYVTPDSQRVVCLDGLYQSLGSVYSIPLTGGTLLRLNDTPAPNGGVVEVSLSPDGARVVYRADQDSDEVFELYSVPVHGGPVTKLNAPLVLGGIAGDADGYLVSPDGTRLVYLADQDEDQVHELFSVRLPGGLPTKLNGPLVRNGEVDRFAFTNSPDSRRVVYVADQELDGVQDLYSVPIDGGPAVKLSTQAVASWDFDVSPDSRWVVFRDVQAYPAVPAIHAVPIDGGPPVELGSTLPSGTVQDVRISPDSSRVVLSHFEQAVSFEWIYSVPITGGTPTKLSPAPVPNGRIFHWRIAPDGAAVYYLGDFEVDEVFELYSVPIDGGPSTKLSGPLVVGGDVLGHTLQFDSGHGVYLAEQDTDGVVELYSVTLSGLVRTKLNPPLVAGGTVRRALIAPDGSRVVYVADQLANDVFELFSVPIGGGPATRLNRAPVAGGDVDESFFWISPGSDRVVYFADQDTNNVVELHSVPIGGGPATKLNGALIPGGDVRASFNSLQFDARSDRIVYIADQDTDELFELYSVPLAGGALEKLSAPLVPGGDVGGDFYYSPFLLARGYVVYRADQDQDETFELYLSFLSLHRHARPR